MIEKPGRSSTAADGAAIHRRDDDTGPIAPAAGESQRERHELEETGPPSAGRPDPSSGLLHNALSLQSAMSEQISSLGETIAQLQKEIHDAQQRLQQVREIAEHIGEPTSGDADNRSLWEVLEEVRETVGAANFHPPGRFGELGDRIANLEARLSVALSISQENQAKLKEWTDATSRELDRLRSRTANLDLRLHKTTVQADKAEREVRAVQESKIWRTLCGTGAIVIGFANRLSWLRQQLRRVKSGSDTAFFELVVEDPPTMSQSPRTGVVQVRGWTLAESKIRKVEVLLDGGQSAEATRGIFRPDLGQAYPSIEGATHGGFLLDIDTSVLSNGKHSATVRAFAQNGQKREVRLEMLIDHSIGSVSDYERWITTFEGHDECYVSTRLAEIAYRPLVSVIVPVFRTVPVELKRAIESVRRQSYPNWELCLADDHSGLLETEEILRSYREADPRIKVTFRPSTGGISAASNSALALAKGDFVALLDHDDEYSQDALFHIVDAINRNPAADVLYSDEDKITVEGGRFEPFFKPDWSPDLLLSMNYVCHLLVFRRSLLEKTGGFRSEYDGSQDHDLTLRLSEHARELVHVPKILYHWRATPNSVACDASQKSYAVDSARRAIEDHLRRRRIQGYVEEGLFEARWRVRYPAAEGAKVSIIIPSGGKVEMLAANIDSIAANTEYQDYEIVVADNSSGDAVRRFIEKWTQKGRRARYFDCRKSPFNYAAINNAAANTCSGECLLFLNDDTSVISPGWLTAMVELALRRDVGAVGAKLLYGNGLIQHAGVILGVFDNCGHAFRELSGGRPHYFGLSDVIRNVSAVTGACLMVRSDVFAEVGGFDEGAFAVAFNDVDLCLRIGRKGYRILYTPHAQLYHYEAGSKKSKDLIPDSSEVIEMQSRWHEVIANDPFYSVNLSRTSEDFSFRTKVG